MGLVLDTNIFIAAEKGRLDPTRFEALSEYGEAYISAVTVSELLAGVQLARSAESRVQRSAFVEGVLSNVPVLDFTEEVARVYATLYAHFLKPRKKSPGNVYDLQIAATAIAHGYAVLTHNVRDFKKVPGLKIAPLPYY